MSYLQFYTQLSQLPASQQQEVVALIATLYAKQLKAPASKVRKFGCAKGAFKMAPDFDAPLDDFKDYQ